MEEWLLNPGTCSRSEGCSSKWLVYRELLGVYMYMIFHCCLTCTYYVITVMYTCLPMPSN